MKAEQNRRRYRSLHEGIGLLPNDGSVVNKSIKVTKIASACETGLKLLPNQPITSADLPTGLPIQHQNTTDMILISDTISGFGEVEHRTRQQNDLSLSRVRICGAHLLDLFFSMSVFVTTWFFGFQLVSQTQPAIELFWKLARKAKFEWWLVERGVPELLWPVAFWAVLAIFVVQTLFVMLCGATVGQSFFGVKLTKDGLIGRLGLWVSSGLGLFGALSLPFVLIWPRRLPVLFWIQLRGVGVGG